jgi:rubredoxin
MPGSPGPATIVRPAVSSLGSSMKKWRCLVCDFVYDEAKGLPEEGIAPGTAWEDIPDSWTCPDCGAAKSDFQMEEI